MRLVQFMKRHPTISYFVLTFLLSWGGIFLVIWGFGGLPATKEQFNAQLPLAIPAMLGGPSIAGILMTGVTGGKKGLRELFSRLKKWRAHIKWYALALLAAPIALIATPLVLSLVSDEYLPGFFITGTVVPLVISGICSGLAVGFCEELGWTGFAVPMLRKRHSVLATGLIMGVVWGAWHVLSNDVWASRTYSGGVPYALFLIVYGLLFLVGQLPAYRILTAWVYDRTGSLPVTMLMHTSLTASTMIFQPANLTGTPFLVSIMAAAAAMWLVVLVVFLASGGLRDRETREAVDVKKTAESA